MGVRRRARWHGNGHGAGSGLGVALIVAMLHSPAWAGAAANLLANGGFEKGATETGEPVGWHTRLTGIIPVPQYADPEQKKGRTGVVQFRCGCGHPWGTVRPWAMLVCPQCDRLNPGLEDSGDLYQQNDQFVEIQPDRGGHAVRLTLPQAIGDNQGVRVISDMVRARRDAGYEIAVDAVSEGPHLRVFVECFRQLPEDSETNQWLTGLPPEANPLKQKARLKRVFRKHINVGSPGTWQRFSERFAAPARSQFDVMFVTLYAYHPGAAAYDDVVLRELSAAELKAYRRENPGPKDPRLR